MDLGINGKVALVTGGNRGIGLASALEMAREGCNVIITDKDEAGLIRAERRIRALGVKTLVVLADLEEASGADKVVSAAFDEFGQVDILFNNAGHIHPCTTISATDTEWESQINIHLMACVRTCRAIIPKMIEKKWGRIINMSSTAGITPGRGVPDYSAAKAAVINYTQSIAMEFSKYGICATALCPGFVHTRIWEGFFHPEAPEKSNDETENLISKSIQSLAKDVSGVKRFARPEEIGKVVTFLASESASFVSGCTIQVDGGALAGIELKKR
uniref:3-oxoacyl-[acyl-carrier protein] reductase n=1 Tax=Candidatus Kentrum sp. FW TaxID=2126338 RepID=A0A450T863_9GAMM|nr:MAG: 3-oxoacyl-[acyl-carrier protein] reductase [Candidatus Kentron sp. FW]VFJ62923.1 MAG: 3-oxoacyl-[acyl-carrier protein] reductase [Candidatus Kentron sp. FW]